MDVDFKRETPNNAQPLKRTGSTRPFQYPAGRCLLGDRKKDVFNYEAVMGEGEGATTTTTTCNKYDNTCRGNCAGNETALAYTRPYVYT